MSQATTSPRIKGKICITTSFDRYYALGGKTMIKSVKHYTDCDGIDFKVITADPMVLKELGSENCHFVDDTIKERYKNVAYSKDLPKEKYAQSWYRYELFNFTEYDRVICIDSDCLCLRDISYLFSEELNEFDIVSVEDHIVSKCFIHFVPELQRQGLNFKTLNERMAEGKIDIQPALIVANKRILDGNWYNRLIEYANTTGFTYSIDEGILNDFIYQNNFKVKLLPLEYDYQDLYEIHCPELPVPENPVIVHCQESKPFKKERASLDKRMYKWHDKWWNEQHFVKTIVAIIVWNRFDNLKRWINCWNACDKTNGELVVVHNLEKDNAKYEQLCRENGITYVPRPNVGFDMGAFQDICKERLPGFPNDWSNLIWLTDDCIPMQKDFVYMYLAKLKQGCLPCYEISDQVKRHVRTTGFMVTKGISRKLVFPADPIRNRQECYAFEHSGFSMYEQFKKHGINPCMVVPDLKDAPVWDSHLRDNLQLMPKHEQVFPPNQVCDAVNPTTSLGVLDDLAIKYKADKCSLFHNFAAKYDALFSCLRKSCTSVLEIGVGHGQSMKMWADYFPNATIHGADISLFDRSCESHSSRIRLHAIDQGNIAQLKDLEQFSPFDIIIDDGNHFWREQVTSFQILFPFVKKDGLYIVEDSCTSYWKEYGNHPFNTIDFFKGLVDAVNLCGRRGMVPKSPPSDYGEWEKGWHRREDCHKDVPPFDSIQFLNAIIVIHKRA